MEKNSINDDNIPEPEVDPLAWFDDTAREIAKSLTQQQIDQLRFALAYIQRKYGEPESLPNNEVDEGIGSGDLAQRWKVEVERVIKHEITDWLNPMLSGSWWNALTPREQDIVAHVYLFHKHEYSCNRKFGKI